VIKLQDVSELALPPLVQVAYTGKLVLADSTVTFCLMASLFLFK
jgi:hypothetical protein